MMAKAAESLADEVMLDLEDAVAPNEKEAARGKIVDALREHDWSDTIVAVRINGLDHPNAYRDLIEIVEGAGEYIDTIVVPKVRRSEDVYVIDTLLGQIEMANDIDNTVGIEVLIEEVEGIQQVNNIAAASDRLEALIFGYGDYSASQGIQLDTIGGSGDYPGDLWQYVRYATVIAARVNGLDAIDGPYADFSNPEGYREQCVRSATLGFDGKWAIHPSQVEIANEVYAPEPDEVTHAQRVIEALEKGRAAGQGAIQLDGEMLDEASIRHARSVVEQAREIGMLE